MPVEWSTEWLKFGQVFANQIRRRLPAAGNKWHMDEVVIAISEVKHWLWRATELCWNLGDAVIRRRSVLAC